MKGPEEYRIKEYGGNESNGVFMIPLSDRTKFRVVASNEAGWEHISIVAISKKGKREVERVPTWNEMNRMKDLFWEAEDLVVQYHPPKSEYVSNHPFCLHLWRPIGQDIPKPPKELVGFVN